MAANPRANEWFIESFIQTTRSAFDSFRNEESDCIYERIVESLTQMVHLKTDCISPHETVSAFGLLRY